MLLTFGCLFIKKGFRACLLHVVPRTVLEPLHLASVSINSFQRLVVGTKQVAWMFKIDATHIDQSFRTFDVLLLDIVES